MDPRDFYYAREDQGRVGVYPTYSVLQENEAGDYLDLVCGGLGLTGWRRSLHTLRFGR